ncbi:hypothetical protein Y032_0651g1147 [Ancylostoma ceylanicum]|uniref:Secreted protein n=1 Tax=Ancylostoma ceylanicum TaxID=53326 RepID=A0A016WIW7_9BILA|nr:hypothetical protein Y032_0651g1147 [Ancylostoma ceylanicum]
MRSARPMLHALLSLVHVVPSSHPLTVHAHKFGSHENRLLSVSTSKQPSFSRNAGIPPQETDPTLYYMYLRGSISHHSPVTLAGCSS